MCKKIREGKVLSPSSDGDIDESFPKDWEPVKKTKKKKRSKSKVCLTCGQNIVKNKKRDAFSYKNIKKWIETQQGIARAAGMVERSRNRDMPQKKRDEQMRKRYAAEGYIRSMQRYLRTGDWDNMYFGEYEEHLTKWKVIAPAGDK